MPLSTDQQAEIDQARAGPQATLRPIAPALEEILFQALPVLDHGFVRVVDYMGDDAAVVQAARVSYGRGTKKVSEDRGLINYLMRHRHTTPFEMCEIKYHVKLPIFVARQWIRHRTANVNEYSARYSVVKDRFYRPSMESIRQQSTTNRQGRDQVADVTTAEDFLRYLEATEAHYADYERMLEKGIARELARIGLPLSVYTEWYWKIDLHNLFHFLSLRMDSHAQQEIRDYANAMFALIQPIVPIAAEGFLDYRLHALTLSGLEIEALRSGQLLATENKRELAEWEEKKKRLCLE